MNCLLNTKEISRRDKTAQIYDSAMQFLSTLDHFRFVNLSAQHLVFTFLIQSHYHHYHQFCFLMQQSAVFK